MHNIFQSFGPEIYPRESDKGTWKMSQAGGDRLQSSNTHGETTKGFTCSESVIRVRWMVHNYWTPSTDISPTITALTFNKRDEMVSAERRVTLLPHEHWCHEWRWLLYQPILHVPHRSLYVTYYSQSLTQCCSTNVETNLKHNAYHKHITLVCLAKTDEILVITTNSLLYNRINPLARKLNVKCNMHMMWI